MNHHQPLHCDLTFSPAKWDTSRVMNHLAEPLLLQNQLTFNRLSQTIAGNQNNWLSYLSPSRS